MTIVTLGLTLVGAASMQAQQAPQATTPATASKYKIDIDYTATPELKDWVENQLRPAVEAWYPIIIADLPSEGFTPPQHFDIKIDPEYKGIAATGGTHVMVSPTWIKSQSARGPVNESVGSVIHELVHVVQQYGRAGRRNPMPGWLTEGNRRLHSLVEVRAGFRAPPGAANKTQRAACIVQRRVPDHRRVPGVCS